MRMPSAPRSGPASTLPSGETITLPPPMRTVPGSSPCTGWTSAGQPVALEVLARARARSSGPRARRAASWPASCRGRRPSARTTMSTPLAYIARPEQRHVVLPADRRPEPASPSVSSTGSVDPSPMPQITRSDAVGMSLRWTRGSAPSGAEQERGAVQRPAAADDGAGDDRDAELGRQRGERARSPGRARRSRPPSSGGTRRGRRRCASRPGRRSRGPSDSRRGAPPGRTTSSAPSAAARAQPPARAVEGGRRVEERRAALHDGDGEGVGGHPATRAPPPRRARRPTADVLPRPAPARGTPRRRPTRTRRPSRERGPGARARPRPAATRGCFARGPASAARRSHHASTDGSRMVSGSSVTLTSASPAPDSTPARRSASLSENGCGMPGGGTGLPSCSPTASSIAPSHGLRSRAPQTESATRPPGRSTRRTSRTACAGSSANISPSRQIATSYDSSGSSIRSRSSTRVPDVAQPDRAGAGARDRRHLGHHVRQHHLARGPDPLRGGQSDSSRTAGQLEDPLARARRGQGEEPLRDRREERRRRGRRALPSRAQPPPTARGCAHRLPAPPYFRLP